MKNINYNYRNENWLITIETNNNGYHTITATGDSYPVIEKIITDTLKDKDIMIKKLIDTILDKYFWNIEA